MKTKLSVNINKIATLRNARGGNNPDVLKVAKDCELFGADGITVHPRPDERHIRRADVPALQAILRTEFNIEGCPTKEFMDLVLRVRPSQVTLVPDKPEQLTYLIFSIYSLICITRGFFQARALYAEQQRLAASQKIS